MRVFSKFEKRFLKQIINLEKADDKIIKPHSFFKGILNIKTQVTIIGHDPDYKLKDDENHYYKIEIKGDKKYTNTDFFEITGKFYEANDLLDYLLQNGYLLRHEGGVFAGLLINPLELENIPEIETIDVHVNKPLSQLLEKCSYYYHPTEALRDLVKHGFRTNSERNNRITRIISISAVIISLISAIISISDNKSKEPIQIENTLKIDSNTIGYIINKIKIEKSDSLLKTSLKLNKRKPTTNNAHQKLVIK